MKRNDLEITVKKKNIKQWLRDHKKDIIIISIGTAATITAVVLLKNPNIAKKTAGTIRGFFSKRTLKAVTADESVRTIKRVVKNTVTDSNPGIVNKVAKATEETISISVAAKPDKAKVVVKRAPHSVAEHMRELHGGRKASAKKIAEAAEFGIELPEGMTLVRAHMRCVNSI